MKIVIVQGYCGNVLVFNNDDGKGWRKKSEILRFVPGYRQHRTLTVKGMMNAGELKRFYRITPKLVEPYDFVELDDDKGLVPVPPPKKRKRRATIKRGLIGKR